MRTNGAACGRAPEKMRQVLELYSANHGRGRESSPAFFACHTALPTASFLYQPRRAGLRKRPEFRTSRRQNVPSSTDPVLGALTQPRSPNLVRCTMRFIIVAITLALSLPLFAAETYDEQRLEKRVLVNGLEDGMEMDVLPDGRILIAERQGALKIYLPK